ncbi:hypothetical protein [Flavobacterium sp. DG2-3]|uniref:hypothetical protein n=1 Tax=Flavobacterium sp. DG2-3 TaxID=3068317 RepID=UPI00273D0683|nr:hypothetical protein [Flavobacterium sp. DG2-3]MDP5200648.1 hypothetical protein [Flavobacterium sp. DG2-3]
MMNKPKNYFLLLIFCLIFCSAQSQKLTCTIYFDDNTSVTGLGKIKSDNFIKFKLNEDAKSTDYDPMIIDKIVIEKDGVSQVFKYKKEIDGFHKWLKVLIEGNVSLYKYDNSGLIFVPSMTPTGFGTNGFGGTNMYSSSIEEYYVAHGEEFEVISISTIGGFGKNFKKVASKFFEDCPILVEKINNKEYKKDKVYDVVKFYNTNCNTENAATTSEIKN